VLPAVTFADVVEECPESEQSGTVQLESDPTEVIVFTQDGLHLRHGSPQMSGNRVLVERLELGEVGNDAPLRKHIREVSLLPEIVEAGSPALPGLE
jgi:hypothetical protein